MGMVLMPRRSGGATVPVVRNPLSSFSVGTVVKLNFNGKPTDFRIVQQGKPSYLYDDSCDGTWLLADEIPYADIWADPRYNEYAKSHIYHALEKKMSQLEPKIRDCVRQVRIPYRPGYGANREVSTGANGLSARMFLLSAPEVGVDNSVNEYIPNDGSRLSYFIKGEMPDARARRAAQHRNQPLDWWLRSPYCDYDYGHFHAASVWKGGDVRSHHCDESYGIRPAMVFERDTLVDKDMNLMGRTGG